MEAVSGTGWTSYASASILAIAREAGVRYRSYARSNSVPVAELYTSRKLCVFPHAKPCCALSPNQSLLRLCATYEPATIFGLGQLRHTSLFSPLAHNSDLLGYLT